MDMEKKNRKCKISITNAGGTAGKGSEKHRIAIPTSWSKAMGFTKEDRNAIIAFDEGKIIITKDNT